MTYTYSNTYYYDLLPNNIFRENGTILEMGCGDGNSQVESRHKSHFLGKGYIGLDIRSDISPKINIMNADVFDYDTDDKFDTVLAIAVIEHIPFSNWPKLFDKLKTWTKKDGYMGILVPHDERLSDYITSLDYEHCLKHYPVLGHGVPCHVVHGITEKVLRHFLPGADVFEVRRKLNFREEGEGLLRPSLRFVKRVLTRHKYIRDWWFRKRYLLVAIWKNTDQ